MKKALNSAPGDIVGDSRRNIMHIFSYLSIIIAMISIVVTYLILTFRTPIVPDEETVILTYYLNGAIVLLLLLAVVGEIIHLVREQIGGRAGARLNWRIVRMFFLAAAAPAILVAIVLTVAWNDNIDRWFSSNISRAIQNTLVVSRAYINEHNENIRRDIFALKANVERAAPAFQEARESFDAFLTQQAIFYRLPLVYIIDDKAQIITRASIGEPITFKDINADFLARVGGDEPALIETLEGQIGAVIKLKNWDNAYLFVGRWINNLVQTYKKLTQETIDIYRQIESMRGAANLAYGLIYIAFSLVLLLSAILIGFAFAERLVRPIKQLIVAADAVAEGALDSSVVTKDERGDLLHLMDRFNNMIARLKEQRYDLLEAQKSIDERRRYTETILESVPTGVLGLDPQGTILFANGYVQELFGETESQLTGEQLTRFLPGLETPVNAIFKKGEGMMTADTSLPGVEGDRSLSVRLTGISLSDIPVAIVVTLSDVTELLRAQRSSAWSDVARRIAHEIKNPLTPIQLSVERLQRKFGKDIARDANVFHDCTATILRQVDNLGRMVDEFSSFARTPRAVLATEDLGSVIREVVLLMRAGYKDMDIAVDLPDEPVLALIDRRLVFQLITNIIKNATETVEKERNKTLPYRRILVKGYYGEKGEPCLDCVDDGPGFPAERSHLLEPYVTTRKQGTGLGLAVVVKIIEEHKARIDLLDASDLYKDYGGALVRVAFQKADEGGA